MAEKIIRYRYDDIEGDDEVRAVETVPFAINGEFYEIDLGQKNLTKFNAQMGPWVEHARRVKGKRKPSTPTAQTKPVAQRSYDEVMAVREQNNAIRAWAKAQGIPVGDKGKIANDVVKAFTEAHRLEVTPEFTQAISE